VYLNGAARSPLPRSVAQRGHLAVDSKLCPWEMRDSSPTCDDVRSLFSALLNGDGKDCVAITSSTSYAMALAAKNCPLSSGECVVVIAGQMASNVLPWQSHCQSKNALLLVAPKSPNLAESVIETALQAPGRVAGIAVGACHWADGSLVDLQAIADFCHSVNCVSCSQRSEVLGWLLMPHRLLE
jgi:selenocysteine lyase/cysteine desulfurase